MPVRIKAEKVESRYLKPGELYSNLGPEYWSVAMDKGIVGLPVLIRANVDDDDNDTDNDEAIYRITIDQVDNQGVAVNTQQMNPHAPPGVKSYIQGPRK